MTRVRERKLRADLMMVERNLVESRAKAQALIMAGRVSVDGERLDKSGTLVKSNACIVVRRTDSDYVSRGGDKLAGAIACFQPHGLVLQDAVAADFGASTGGFVDCLLQHGVARVHAIDVGVGLLHQRIRNDPRVIVRERTNARYVTAQTLNEHVDLVVIDASFISIDKLLNAARDVLKPEGQLVALIKPQFEAGRADATKGRGVIRDEALRQRLIDEAMRDISSHGFVVVADARSVVTGPKGNIEHFVFANVLAKHAGHAGDQG